MGVKSNLIGQKFGKLTVLREVPIEERPRPKYVFWECQCECGNKVKVITNYLKTGHTKSCGCWRGENMAKLFTKDISNQIFGHLTAIRPTEKRGSDGSIIWECQCDCGNITYVSTNSLSQNSIISCGHVKSKGEEKIQKILEENHIDFKKQYYFSDFISPVNTARNFYYYFDFAIFKNNELHCLVEYQGIQHYQDLSGGKWASGNATDELKRQYCNDHNITLIEIPYTDFNIIDFKYLKNKLCL